MLGFFCFAAAFWEKCYTTIYEWRQENNFISISLHHEFCIYISEEIASWTTGIIFGITFTVLGLRGLLGEMVKVEFEGKLAGWWVLLFCFSRLERIPKRGERRSLLSRAFYVLWILGGMVVRWVELVVL